VARDEYERRAQAYYQEYLVLKALPTKPNVVVSLIKRALCLCSSRLRLDGAIGTQAALHLSSVKPK
jgi:hypothetical protein